jgi:hypothetical protein
VDCQRVNVRGEAVPNERVVPRRERFDIRRSDDAYDRLARDAHFPLVVAFRLEFLFVHGVETLWKDAC